MRNRIYELHKNMIAVSAACSKKETTQETADDRKNATVTYNFATGDTVTIELEEGTEVAVYITESKRLEERGLEGSGGRLFQRTRQRVVQL